MRQMVDNSEQLLAETHALGARDEGLPAELPPLYPLTRICERKNRRETLGSEL